METKLYLHNCFSYCQFLLCFQIICIVLQHQFTCKITIWGPVNNLGYFRFDKCIKYYFKLSPIFSPQNPPANPSTSKGCYQNTAVSKWYTVHCLPRQYKPRLNLVSILVTA